MSEQRTFNKRLKDTYSSNLRGEALFRISWSDSQTENRWGTFRDTVGEVFIREVSERRVCKKYPHIKERWVLERWMPPSLLQDAKKELPDAAQNGSYEPIYVFENEDGNFLPLDWEFTTIVVQTALAPLSYAESMANKEDRAMFDKTIIGSDRKQEADEKAFYDQLCQEGSSFEGKLSGAAGEGVVVLDSEYFANKLANEKQENQLCQTVQL